MAARRPLLLCLILFSLTCEYRCEFCVRVRSKMADKPGLRDVEADDEPVARVHDIIIDLMQLLPQLRSHVCDLMRKTLEVRGRFRYREQNGHVDLALVSPTRLPLL